MKEKIRKAIAAHGAWKERLSTAISTGRLEIQIASIKADNLCEFGKWLYSEAASIRDAERYARVKDLHAQFHLAASAVAELALAGKVPEAEESMAGKYSEISAKLTKEMVDWDASL